MSEIMLQIDYEFLLNTLPKKQREVIKLRGLGYTLSEIAKSFFVTRERIRQLETCAIRKIRKIYNIDGRRTYGLLY